MITKYFTINHNQVNQQIFHSSICKTNSIIGLDLILGRLQDNNELLPSEVDLDGALKAIARIQETYHLPPSYIAAGLRDKPTDELQLGVQDTYSIGRDSYLQEKYYNTKIWMEEALRQMDGSMDKDGVKITDILDHLAWVEYKVRIILSAEIVFLPIIEFSSSAKELS